MLDAWIPPPQQGSNKTSFPPAAVTDKIGVSPQIQTQQGRDCGSRGHRRSGGHDIRDDPGDPTTKEREDYNAAHIPFRSWCSICVKAAHRKRRGKERSCKDAIAFDHKTLAKRTMKMTRQQSLCTKTNTPK